VTAEVKHDLSTTQPVPRAALLPMRLMIGAIFITGGWSHVTDTDKAQKASR